MAIQFGSSSALAGAIAQSSAGEDLQEITVESLSFKGLNGEKKLKLLPAPWPTTELPSSTSSLLSISSRQALLAAAGPNALILARTKDVRDAFHSTEADVADNVKPVQPALTIEIPRLSQVAFNADGSCLIICAEVGGGLAVYDTQALLQNQKEPAFQIPTNNTSVRSLWPNPAPEFAHLIAVVLSDGKLLIANLREKSWSNNATGSPCLKDGVAAVSWSNRGKQLTAGMADGNCLQLDQQGTVKASIPVPPGLAQPSHVSSLVWLANEEWLVIHTPNNSEEPDRPPPSLVHHIQTDKQRSQFIFRRQEDPAGAWGMNRVPLIHYTCRLRNWYNIKDWLVMTSVASTDVAMLTNAAQPLGAGYPSNSYTITAFADDSSRISVPMSVTGATDTTPIGLAIDLSATEKIPRPIPGDEMDEAPFPLPAVMLLNNEGVLVASWAVYHDALRNKASCPDVIATESSAPAALPQSPPRGAFGLASPATSTFGASSKAATPAFGQAAFGQPAFGSAGGAAFGGASQVGSRQSVWGSSANTSKLAGATFGQTSLGAAQPTFGSASAFGVGAAGGASPFAAATTNKPAASPFGSTQPSNGTKTAANPFGAYNGANGASPFGSAASTQSVFGQSAKPAFGAPATGTAGSFGGMSSQPSFGSTVSIDASTGGSTLGSKSAFGTPAQQGGLFGQKAPTLTPAETQESDMMDDEGDKTATPKGEKTGGIFDLGPKGFKLGSTFKPGNQEDGAEDEIQEQRPKGLFGADFGGALDDAKKEREKTVTPPIKKENDEQPKSIFGIPAAKKDDNKPSLFGTPAAKKAEDKPSSAFGEPSSKQPAFSFGKPSPVHNKEPEPPQVTSKPAPSPSTTTATSDASKRSSDRSKNQSEDDSLPLAGSEAEAIEMPDSDDESHLSTDEADDEDGEEEESDAEGDDDTADGSPDESDDAASTPPTISKIQAKHDAQSPLQAPSLSSASTTKAESISQTIPDDAPLPPMPTNVPKGFYDAIPSLSPYKSAQPRQPSPLGQKQMNAESQPFGGEKLSTTPAGFPKFAPPTQPVPRSPRSPSPTRSASTPAGRLTSRPSSRPTSGKLEIAKPILPPPKEKVTPASLQDKEAERNRAILAAPLEPTLDLPEFVAHQDYVSQIPGDQISHQVERLFHDINSMLDTLGLNARALSEFVEGQHSLIPDGGRTIHDLENEENDEGWCLVEIEDLMNIEQSLSEEIDAERIEDKDARLHFLYSMRKELARAKSSLKEIKKFLHAAQDEGKAEARRKAPLDKTMEARQRQVRHDMAEFMSRLVKAEEAVSMARVKLASATKGAGAGGQVPTVEAVERTVRKMTAWAEEKAADMDVLEAQMLKLGLASHRSPGMRASMRNSYFGASVGSKKRQSGMFSTPGSQKASNMGRSFAVPEDSDDEELVEGFEMLDLQGAELREMVEDKKRRDAVLKRVRAGMQKRGVRVVEA